MKQRILEIYDKEILGSSNPDLFEVRSKIAKAFDEEIILTASNFVATNISKN